MNPTSPHTSHRTGNGSPWTQIGTAAYVVWGILHLGLGLVMTVPKILAGVTSEQEAESLMFFVCAVVFGVQAIVVAWFLGRRNVPFGYWLNLLALGVIDAVFLFVMVLPGHVDLIGGLSGPLIWLIAAVSSTIGMIRARRS